MRNSMVKSFYPKPLTFDKVMEGRELAAQKSWLFFFPAEITEYIFSFVLCDDDRKTLRALAMVNSDCRQLGRSFQFRVVTLDGSLGCQDGILAVLQREAFERRQYPENYGKTQRLSLGVCIQWIIISEDGFEKYMDYVDDHRPPWLISRRRGFRVESHATHDERVMAQKWLDHRHEVIKYYNQVYTADMLSVFAGLPFLERVKASSAGLAGGLVLEHHVLNTFIGSTLRHLHLRAVMAERCPCLAKGVVWPLSSLDLHLEWGTVCNASQGFIFDASPFCQSILGLCCTTLERLSMRIPSVVAKGRNRYPVCPVSFNLSFPQLHRVDLLEAGNLDHSALQSFLETSKELSLGIDYTPYDVPWFSDDAAVADHPPPEVKKYHNEQCSCRNVLFETAQTRGLLELLLPLLSRCRKLKKMSMGFEGSEERSNSLQVLEKLHTSSLEELHMGPGQLEGPGSFCWRVDHDIIRSKLPTSTNRLQQLMFFGDVYSPSSSSSSMARCYKPSAGEHLLRMTAEATKYGSVFPLLKFVYIGGLLFQIVRNGPTVTVNPLYLDKYFWRNRQDEAKRAAAFVQSVVWTR